MGSVRSLFTVEIGMVMMVAIMWISSVPMARTQDDAGVSELGQCWFTIDDCITSHENDTTNPKFDPSSPSFDKSEYLCCSSIQDTFKNDKPCFCTLSTYLHQNVDGPNSTIILSFCNTVSSLDDFDAFCAGASSPAAAPTSD